MIVKQGEQGTTQWHIDRAGVITASMFTEIRRIANGLDDKQQAYVNHVLKGHNENDAAELAGYKAKPQSERIRRAINGEKVGEYTQAAQDYAFRTALERIQNYPLDQGYETWAMRWGKEQEVNARLEHEQLLETLVEPIGLVTTDCERFGASADGLVGKTGGAEYKCFLDPAKIRSIIIDRDLAQFTDQVQGGMWITGREWWDFCLYCPALASAGGALQRFRFYRDEAYIERMASDLEDFDALVEYHRDRILEACMSNGANISGVADTSTETQPEAERASASAEGVFQQA